MLSVVVKVSYFLKAYLCILNTDESAVDRTDGKPCVQPFAWRSRQNLKAFPIKEQCKNEKLSLRVSVRRLAWRTFMTYVCYCLRNYADFINLINNFIMFSHISKLSSLPAYNIIIQNKIIYCGWDLWIYSVAHNILVIFGSDTIFTINNEIVNVFSRIWRLEDLLKILYFFINSK